MNRRELGSITAKGGFENEADIVRKFENYKNDNEAKKWLYIMGFDPTKISKLSAIQIPPNINENSAIDLGASKEELYESVKFKKADVQIRVNVSINNLVITKHLSLKKANRNSNFNQIDKRSVDTYKLMWGFDDRLSYYLKLFTGEINPFEDAEEFKYINLRDPKKKRLFLDEIPDEIIKEILNFFNNNKVLVIADLLMGRGFFSSDYFLITEQTKDYTTRWLMRDINYVLNFYSLGNVELSPGGSLKIGKITMQRKGGTPDPTSLQFKFKPLDLFDEQNYNE